MSFFSILHPESPIGNERVNDASEEPTHFHDLNLDQIVDAITVDKQEYNLKPFFYTPLTNLLAIAYRQEIMKDIESGGALLQEIKDFSKRMRDMRNCLASAEKLYYQFQKERQFLNAIRIYVSAVEALLQALNQATLNSRGLLAFRDLLERYAQSERFKTLFRETRELVSALAAIRYGLFVNGNRVTVSPTNSELDYSAIVENLFSKFKDGTVKDYRFKLPDPNMGHVQAQILDRVALLNPSEFKTLKEYCEKNKNFLEKFISDFDREIQFYVAYLDYMILFKNAGLKFCYPEVIHDSKDIHCREGFDLALARQIIRKGSSVVSNNFFTRGNERIFIVIGPNQGGKTTFSRTFGQLHYLAVLGLPVPGIETRLFLFDHLLTHFEHGESREFLRGKLKDDLVRIHEILNRATPRGVIILNEIFSSTSVKDALYLSERIIERILRLDCLCVCVTFLDRLSSLDEKIVSLVAEISPHDPARRTYKVERAPANGRAYALAIAEKYRLTYGRIKKRIHL